MKPFDYEKYGQPGSLIPGSTMIRAYTEDGTPIRVYRESEVDRAEEKRSGHHGVNYRTPNAFGGDDGNYASTKEDQS